MGSHSPPLHGSNIPLCRYFKNACYVLHFPFPFLEDRIHPERRYYFHGFQVFSAAGYRCLAFDMPGCGKTGGPTAPDSEKGEVIPLAMRALELDSVSFKCNFDRGEKEIGTLCFSRK